MKKLLLIIPLILMVACQSSSEKIAFTAISGAGTTTDSAIGAFNDYRKTHNVDSKLTAQVFQAAKIYDASLTTVSATITAIKNGKATDADYQVAVAASRAAAANLLSIVSIIIPTK